MGSCQSSRPFSECESNIKELRKGALSKYAVNCSDYNNLSHNYCSIESYIQNGKANVILRACTDGIFSFSLSQLPYHKFKYLNPEKNMTMCTVIGYMAVCATLCSTDMCNGPSGASSNVSWAISVQLFLGYLLYLQLAI